MSLWAFSPLRSKTGLDLNPIFWLMFLDATSGSEARPRWCLQAIAWVDVHLRRLPHLGLGLLKVPLNLNDRGSLAAKDDLVAPLSAFART